MTQRTSSARRRVSDTRPKSLRRRVWAATRLLRLYWRYAQFPWMSPVIIKGTQNLPRRGAVIVYANHPTVREPRALFTALNRNAVFLAKDSLFKHWLLGPILRWFGHIPVARGTDAARQASDFALKVLLEGGVVVIFPEGGCTPDGQSLGDFKGGLSFMAQQAQVRVVPALITGTTTRPPVGWRRWFERKPPVTVEFLQFLAPPARPDDETAASDARQAFTELARQTLLKRMLASQRS